MSFVKRTLILAALSPVLAAGLVCLLYHVIFLKALMIAEAFLAVGLFRLVQHKVKVWMAQDDGPLIAFYGNAFRILCFCDALLLLLYFQIHPFISALFLALVYDYGKRKANDFKSSRNNMMIMVQRPEGDFQSAWVHRSKGSEIWCVSYDKDNHGMLLRRVTENKKGSEGQVTLESGAKSAKLFEWDGNKSILNSGVRRGEYSYQSPEYDVPINASVMGEVKF